MCTRVLINPFHDHADYGSNLYGGLGNGNGFKNHGFYGKGKYISTFVALKIDNHRS